MDKKIKIAILDHHLLLRKSFASLLESFGYSVHSDYSNGKEFVTALDNSDLPDIVLMETNMPVMDGFETTLWLRNNYPSIKVLAFSISYKENELIRMIRNGAKGYIFKGIHPEELKLAINSILENGFYDSSIGAHKILQSTFNTDVADNLSRLNEKEKEFLKLVSLEMTYEEIAYKMGLSSRTIDGYRDDLFEKLNVKSRVGLVLAFMKAKILESQFLERGPNKTGSQGYNNLPNDNDYQDKADAASTFGNTFSETSIKPLNVKCSVFAPLTTCPNENIMVQVFAHLHGKEDEARNLALQFDSNAQPRGSKILLKAVEVGSELTFYLSMTGVQVDDAVQKLIWSGETEPVQFGIYIPEDHKGGTVIGTVYVTQDSVPFGHLKFSLMVIAPNSKPMNAVESDKTTGTWKRYHYAFISYASSDRAEVLKRVQMLPRAGIEFFQDLLTLEPGERWEKSLYKYIDKSDVFFLFWSNAAKSSKWVMQEVNYAIKKKGDMIGGSPEIVPIIIEGPPPVSPPSELKDMHFNDAFIYFINSTSKKFPTFKSIWHDTLRKCNKMIKEFILHI